MSDTYDTAPRMSRVRSRRSLSRFNTIPSKQFTQTDGTETFSQNGIPLTLVDGHPIAVRRTLGRRLQLALKRCLIDLPMAAAATIVLSPILIGIAVAIKLTSPGPVFFVQSRVGLNGREFRLLKFRTMYADACDADGHQQVIENDERVTPIGRFLRATSFDELPQLWNILKGDMAVIGPRPMVPGMRAAGRDYHDIVPYYDYRNLVKPGLSGWAQANGLRGPTGDVTSARARIDHDCAYVQNFTLSLDVKIIIMTIVREFLTGSGV